MADNQGNSVLGNISDFSILMDRLKIKNQDKQNEKLNKNIENLNKNILSLAKKILPSTGLGETISDISSRRKTYDSFGTLLRNRVFGNRETGNTLRNKFFSLRGALDTFGVVKRGSGSVFDQLLDRRDARNQFIADQLKVNPQMMDTAANRKTFGRKFDTQQVLQKELNATQREIDRLRDSGFTDKQIARSGLIKQRNSAAAKLAASDNRLYSKIKDELVDTVKEGILEGIEDAAKEAKKRLDEMDKADKGLKRQSSNPFKSKQSEEEAAREEEIIQKGILQGQQELLSAVKGIKDALDSDDKGDTPEKQEGVFGGWLKGILGTIGGFLISKMTGIVGMLTSGISSAISPILKVLGIGKVASTAGSIAGSAAGAAGAPAAGGAAVKKSTGVLGKLKGMIKSVAPKIPAAVATVGGLLLSKPALIAGAAAGAGYLGYSMLPDSVKKPIDDTIAKFLGDEPEEQKITKNIPEQRVEKPVSKIGEVLENKINEVKESNKNKATDSPTIISNPVTNNTSNSVVNNHFRSQPRNSEPTYNNYVINRFAVS